MFYKYIAKHSRKQKISKEKVFRCDWTTALTCWIADNFTKRLGFYKS